MSIKSKQLGRYGEDLASRYLEQKGYQILERNYRWARAEVDIIARKENLLIFVEVKTAASPAMGEPISWVHEKKQRQVALAAQHYLQAKEIHGLDCRFDVIGIIRKRGSFNITHIENAFWLPPED